MFSTIRARNAHGGFSEKNLDHSKITKMCYFSRFFEIISKTLLTIFPVFAVNVALNSIFQPAKTVCQKKFRSQDIWGSVFELFEWSKKIFENFLKKFLNGPIRKVIMSKVKFEDLRLSPVLAIPVLVIFRPKTRKSQFSLRQPYEVVWLWNLQETIRTKSYGLWTGQKVPFTHLLAINGQIDFDHFLVK